VSARGERTKFETETPPVGPSVSAFCGASEPLLLTGLRALLVGLFGLSPAFAHRLGARRADADAGGLAVGDGSEDLLSDLEVLERGLDAGHDGRGVVNSDGLLFSAAGLQGQGLAFDLGNLAAEPLFALGDPDAGRTRGSGALRL